MSQHFNDSSYAVDAEQQLDANEIRLLVMLLLRPSCDTVATAAG